MRRELDFYYAAPPGEFLPGAEAIDPMDQIMIRGRIDVLLPAPDGLTLIDYKTDRLAPEKIDERAAFYRDQVQRYREAMEKITGKKVAAVHLIFLDARKVITL